MQQINKQTMSDTLSEIHMLTSVAYKQMWIHCIITLITFFLTILSVSLNLTDDYTADHIFMYLFTSLMTLINFGFNYIAYKKLNTIEEFVDPVYIESKLKDVSCIGFYESILNFIWFLISVIIEAIIISDNVDNKKQAFLIVQFVLVICVALYNLTSTCKTCCKSYVVGEHVGDTMIGILMPNSYHT